MGLLLRLRLLLLSLVFVEMENVALLNSVLVSSSLSAAVFKSTAKARKGWVGSSKRSTICLCLQLGVVEFQQAR